MKKITSYYFKRDLTSNLLFGKEISVISEGSHIAPLKSNMVSFSQMTLFRDTFDKVLLTNSNGIKNHILGAGVLLTAASITYPSHIDPLTFFFMKFNDGLAIVDVFILSNYVLGILPVLIKDKNLRLNKIIQTD